MGNKIEKEKISKPEITIVSELEKAIKSFVDEVDGFVYPLIIPPLQSIDEDILFEIYPQLKSMGKQKKLHVLLYSYGGDAHTAFHVGRLLQDCAEDELFIYILREAKSAATLIACAADKIILSEISELGPMDPQIKQRNSEERFSPLAIKHAFELLHDQSSKNHEQIVNVLAERLPDPLILGEHLKSLETGKDYLIKLMKARMFKGYTEDKIISIADKLVTGYPDHSYCIDYIEAKSLGLKVEKINVDYEILFFEIMKRYKNVWDKFNSHFYKMKNKDDDDTKEALHLYSDLKKLSRNIIDYQRNRQSKEAVPKGKLSNNKIGKK